MPGTFTYSVPDHLRSRINPGMRVAVEFGRRKIYTGIIAEIHFNKPEAYKVRDIYELLDSKPLVLDFQIQLWKWMANYYMANLGDLYKNALPAAFKPESNTYVRLKKDAELPTDAELDENAQLLLETLHNRSSVSLQEISAFIPLKKVITSVKALLDLGVIELEEKLIKKYKPKIENYIRVSVDKASYTLLQALESLKNASKQYETFLTLISEESLSDKPILLSSIIKKTDSNYAVIRSLEKKKLVEVYQLKTDRVANDSEEIFALQELSPAQSLAKKEIDSAFVDKNIVLLHGVTSSGKTEIYMHLMQQVIDSGKKVLFILPEISLTTQLTARIRKFFGGRAGIYHSKFNNQERVEIWMKTLQNEYDIIIGPRSAIFLPLQDVGLIIVDEEHETSLKQSDSRPYFHARDTAIYLATLIGAKVLLGSATPSLDTYYSAKIAGKFGYVELTEKFGGIIPPEVHLIDLRDSMKRKRMNGHIADALKDSIQSTVEKGKQVLIFQNRRGFAPVLECIDCAHAPMCPNCDVTLTFHLKTNQLQCHYCGHNQAKPIRCPQCSGSAFDTKGVGTEQVEQNLQNLFPDYSVARVDTDTMRRKNAFHKMLQAIEKKEVDIIVGTQMITKGLDFEHMQTIGVIRADSLMNIPEFRAHEYTFQRLVQVSGRAGRRQEQGQVYFQTFQVDHPIIQAAKNSDYSLMANTILAERKETSFPPFSRLIHILISHTRDEVAQKTAFVLHNLLAGHLTAQMLFGPDKPYIHKLNNRYRYHILIKILPEYSNAKIKKLIQDKIAEMHQHTFYRKALIDIDVDPV